MVDKLGEVLEEILAAKDMKEKVDIARLKTDWDEIVGGLFSAHVEVIKIENGRLLLRASDPGWSHQADMMKRNVKKAINNHFGYQLVKEIRVVN